MLANLGNEVLISVLGAIVLFLFQRLYTNWIKPLIIARSQKTADISGVWTGYKPDSPTPQEPTSELEIHQTGIKLKATVKRWKAPRGRIREFNYLGEIRSGQLILQYEDAQAPDYIVGAMVLKLSSNLDELHGMSTYYHHDEGKVVSSERLYRR